MIAIIGAGPAGCYLGYLLAKAGKKVRIFEEHSKIGEPVQCTGIVTSEINKILKIKKDCIINEISRARIYAPNGKFIELQLRKKNLILDRGKFDNYLADMAIGSGAKIVLKNKFLEFKEKKIIVSDNGKKKEIKAEHIIGADGPASKVAKSAGIYGKRKFLVGIQARVKLKNKNIVEFYPYIGQFSWIVPESKDIVRIGAASYSNVGKDFEKFLKLKKVKSKDIIEKQGGAIPIYNPSIRIQKRNVFLLGDAAMQVKATTGGGIIQGLLAAECLSEALIKKRNYEFLAGGGIGKELWMHLKLRKVMDRFKAKDWNYLVGIFNKKKNKRLIEDIDRDHVSKILVGLLINEPRLLFFLKYLI